MLKLLLTIVACLCCSSADAANKPLRVGAAEADITPPVGYRMSGYFHERLNTGTRDPLKARALYLEQGEVRAALVFCDLIGVPAGVVERARKLISEQSGVPGENLLVAATHSHTGPLYLGVLRDHFHRLAVERRGSDPQEAVDYSELLVRQIAAAVGQARQQARPAQLSAGVAARDDLSFNRRFHMKNGSVVFNPGRLNPDIVRPAGPIDPDVGILLARDADSARPLVALTVFALHLDTVGGTLYSADYPYFLERDLRKQWGDELVSLFGAGTCGDINHIDVKRQPSLGAVPDTERIGTALASTVIGAADSLRPIEGPSLAVAHATIEVPAQSYTPEQIAAARENISKVGTRELSFLEQVEACKIMSIELRGQKTLPLDVQVFRLDDEVALLALPGEVFVELGLEIKRKSPFKTTLVVELANDCPHYVPTRKAFAEGSYETVNSIIEVGGGEKLVERAVSLLDELHRK
jgi:neutral ceramidase